MRLIVRGPVPHPLNMSSWRGAKFTTEATYRRSRDSLTGTVMSHITKEQWFHYQQGHWIVFFSTVSYSMGISGSSQGVKRPWRKAHHWPVSSADVKNEWSNHPSPPACRQGMRSDSVTFTSVVQFFMYILRYNSPVIYNFFNSCPSPLCLNSCVPTKRPACA